MTDRDNDLELKKDLNAAVQARKDLGPEYDSALVDSFLEKLDSRLDSQIERRVRRQLAEQTMDRARPPARGGSGGRGGRREGRSFGALPYVSMVFAVPLSAIGAVNEGLAGLVVTWGGILGVNVAHAWAGRRAEEREREEERRASDWEG